MSKFIEVLTDDNTPVMLNLSNVEGFYRNRKSETTICTTSGNTITTVVPFEKMQELIRKITK